MELLEVINGHLHIEGVNPQPAVVHRFALAVSKRIGYNKNKVFMCVSALEELLCLSFLSLISSLVLMAPLSDALMAKKRI